MCVKNVSVRPYSDSIENNFNAPGVWTPRYIPDSTVTVLTGDEQEYVVEFLSPEGDILRTEKFSAPDDWTLATTALYHLDAIPEASDFRVLWE